VKLIFQEDWILVKQNKIRVSEELYQYHDWSFITFLDLIY